MKRFLTTILVCLLALCLTTSAMALVLRPGDSGSNVLALQQALNKAGYGTLVLDGKYGTATTNAVRRFQLDHYLVVDGKAGPLTLSALNFTSSGGTTTTTSTVLKRGSTGTAVVELQNLLARYGYPVGTADGKFGTNTYRAVVAFQQLNGLKVDGKAGPQTMAKLRSGNVVYYNGTITQPTNPGTATQSYVITKVVLSNTRPVVGDTIRASIVPSAGTATYAWYRNNRQVSTGNAYKVTASDLNATLYCVATGYGRTSGTVASNTTSPVTEVVGGVNRLQGTIEIPSRAAVGTKITATADLNSSEVYYQWYMNGVSISGANSRSLNLTENMVGQDIQVAATAISDTLYTGTVRSNYCYVTRAAVVEPGDDDDHSQKPLTGNVYFTVSTVNPGQTITPIVEGLSTTNVSYNWIVEGAVVGNGKNLFINNAWAGKLLTLQVVANSGSGYIGSLSATVNVGAGTSGGTTGGGSTAPDIGGGVIVVDPDSGSGSGTPEVPTTPVDERFYADVTLSWSGTSKVVATIANPNVDESSLKFAWYDYDGNKISSTKSADVTGLTNEVYFEVTAPNGNYIMKAMKLN